MKIILSVAVVLSVCAAACGKRGLQSKACVDFFSKTEECAAKASPIKAQVLRASAETSKANFEKNSNPIAVEKSCELMLDTLTKDPECK